MLDKVQYWLDLADEDMITAELLFNGKRLLAMGFFCHLIAEKAIKAVVTHNTGETPPKIHDLKALAVKGGIYDDLTEEQKGFLKDLMPLHIEGRYSEYKNQVAKSLTVESCGQILKETGELLCWIKKKLGK